MASVSIEARDERTITLRFPVQGAEMGKLHAYIKDCEEGGYALVGCSTISGGHQRDPTVVGVKLLFRRTP